MIPSESKLSDIGASSESMSAASEDDIADAKKLLAFTAHLLQNAYNKELYNSTEVRKLTFFWLKKLSTTEIEWMKVT